MRIKGCGTPEQSHAKDCAPLERIHGLNPRGDGLLSSAMVGSALLSCIESCALIVASIAAASDGDKVGKRKAEIPSSTESMSRG
eukprot:7626894-Ditylum_brightwellii.AAC.1